MKETLTRDGKRYVLLPEDEYNRLIERLDDLEDLADLDQAARENEGDAGVPYEEFRKELGLKSIPYVVKVE